MSANERGINLPTENELGEGLPGYQAAIEERSESDRLKSIKSDAYGDSDSSFLTHNHRSNIINGLELSTPNVINDSKHFVPTNNNPTKISSSSESASDSASKSKLDELKDIPNLNESQTVSPSISTQNIVHGLDLKKEPTTYVISNTRSCTLQLKSSGFVEIGNKKNKVCMSRKFSIYLNWTMLQKIVLCLEMMNKFSISGKEAKRAS